MGSEMCIRDSCNHARPLLISGSRVILFSAVNSLLFFRELLSAHSASSTSVVLRSHFVVVVPISTTPSTLAIRRVSEYILIPTSDHHLRGCDVAFWIKRNGRVTRLISSIIDSENVLFTEIELVSLHFRSAKNDTKGKGHVLSYGPASSTTDSSNSRTLFIRHI